MNVSIVSLISIGSHFKYSFGNGLFYQKEKMKKEEEEGEEFSFIDGPK